jgi:hypothetical protein
MLKIQQNIIFICFIHEFDCENLIEQRFECFILELVGQTLVECLQRSAILGKAMIATDQMFQQPTRRVLAQLNDHFALKMSQILIQFFY